MKLIEKQVNKYPIQVLSRTLGIARSRIYRHLEGKVSSRRKASERLEQAIRQVYLESNKIYGAPKVYAALIRQDIKTNLKRVQRHMKAMGIRSIIRKRYRPCCSKQAKPVCHHPNIVKLHGLTPVGSSKVLLKKEEVYMKQYRNYEEVHYTCLNTLKIGTIEEDCIAVLVIKPRMMFTKMVNSSSGIVSYLLSHFVYQYH